MEHYGIWGLIPPVLTIILALVSRDVIFSLFVGIFSGTLIVAGGNPVVALMSLTDTIASSLADSWNIRIFLFCALLGALLGLLSCTGAAYSFGKWASRRIKTKTGALLFTWFFGLIIFIDDYFNSLTIGTVMRPITDESKISRAKLAFILDSTAAPVCILAPISSWVVTVMSYIKDADKFNELGISEFSYFIHVIPYNLYALLAIFMVVFLIFTHRDYGPMARSEKRAEKGHGLFDEKRYGAVVGNVDEKANGNRANPVDMLFPILLLIALAVAFFPITTWFGAIDGETVTSFAQAVHTIPVGQAFNDTDASVALMYAMIITLVCTYVYYIGRRLMNIQQSAEAIMSGLKSMVPALVILTLAWSIGSIIKSSPADGGLGLSKYLADVVVNGGFPLNLLPVVVFLLSCAISFSTGTSWGTFAIMIPIVMPISVALGQQAGLAGSELLAATMAPIGAVLGGAIFGDHASPISDTTILSSTGANCPHLEHVATQVPYALTIASCALIGHVVAGSTLSAVYGLITAFGAMIIAVYILPKLPFIYQKHHAL
ncbi:MAG: Na+/H+ antiporter NhaC family protein [Spartobacteria bacterium]|nr:Na+/H+ antiporter NhaC family protein [Spartobacteria bacterium]